MVVLAADSSDYDYFGGYEAHILTFHDSEALWDVFIIIWNFDCKSCHAFHVHIYP